MGSASEPSASSSEGVGGLAEEYSDQHLFPRGHNPLYSPSCISISIDEFQLLSIAQADKWEEVDTSTLGFEDVVWSISRSRAQSSKKSNSQWKGFVQKLKKKPTVNLPNAFQIHHNNKASIPSTKKTSTILHSFHQRIPSQLPTLKKSSIKKLAKKGRGSTTHSKTVLAPQLDADICNSFESSWKNFSLSQLQRVTNDFSDENVIGEGGYSIVYKGLLEGGELVAVKRLTTGDAEQMITDYLSELGILVHVNHPNIANVIGYGVEGGMHLVLPLSPHGSLESMLAEFGQKLVWSCRYNIAVGTAQGLAYLHEGCQRRIIHRDIKAANILLTENFEPQISDFGLAKWLPDQWTHLTMSQFEGTFGYLPPEFFVHGIVDEKTDVYAYGVLLLEIITGRPAIDESHNSVVMWAKPLLLNKKIKELVDPSLGNMYDSEQVNCMVMIASLCIQEVPTERPKMSQVVRMLQGDEGILQSKKMPSLKQSCPIEDKDEECNSMKHRTELTEENGAVVDKDYQSEGIIVSRLKEARMRKHEKLILQ